MPAVDPRLTRIARKQTLRLTHYGRKSGKAFEVTIWFTVEDGNIYLSTGNVNRNWVWNVRKNSRIKMTVGGEAFEGEARFITDADALREAMRRVRRKYWMYLPLIGLWRLLAVIGLIKYEFGAFEVTVFTV
jgi:deazaflavin-dependent oxidoreductase (nitroreductase family)